MSTAAKVAEHKQKHPERYCPANRCLWRTAKLNHATGERECGGYCPRHNGAGRAGVPVRPSPAHPEVRVDPANHTLIPSARQSQASQLSRSAGRRALRNRRFESFLRHTITLQPGRSPWNAPRSK
jgi:hypothetical protein